jgi:hypothetical protein
MIFDFHQSIWNGIWYSSVLKLWPNQASEVINSCPPKSFFTFWLWNQDGITRHVLVKDSQNNVKTWPLVGQGVKFYVILTCFSGLVLSNLARTDIRVIKWLSRKQKHNSIVAFQQWFFSDSWQFQRNCIGWCKLGCSTLQDKEGKIKGITGEQNIPPTLKFVAPLLHIGPSDYYCGHWLFRTLMNQCLCAKYHRGTWNKQAINP